MAQAKTIKFGKTAILLGDDESDEEFAAPCGLTSLTMTVNVETNTTNVPDCDDPDLPAWLETDIVSQQMVLAGSGVLDKDAMQSWQDWFMEGNERNVRWFRNLTAGEGGGYFQAPAILTQYEESGERGGRWNVSIGIALNGKPTFVPVS
jgi:hypothetical protein